MLITAFKIFLLKRKNLALWKKQKELKWLSEGQSLNDIKKELKQHKVSFWKTYKIIKKSNGTSIKSE